MSEIHKPMPKSQIARLPGGERLAVQCAQDVMGYVVKRRDSIHNRSDYELNAFRVDAEGRWQSSVGVIRASTWGGYARRWNPVLDMDDAVDVLRRLVELGADVSICSVRKTGGYQVTVTDPGGFVSQSVGADLPRMLAKAAVLYVQSARVSGEVVNG